MDKNYTVVYLCHDFIVPIKEEKFSGREECVKFILDNVYDIIGVKFGEHYASVGGLLCWMGDLIELRTK